MKRLFTEKEVREIIGKNEEVVEPVKNHPDKVWYKAYNEIRNQLRQEQLAILEKMRGEGKV